MCVFAQTIFIVKSKLLKSALRVRDSLERFTGARVTIWKWMY